jgi:vesicle-fusing ATPase
MCACAHLPLPVLVQDRRLLIIATTGQRDVLRQMELLDAFDGQIEVPLIQDTASVRAVSQKRALFAAPKDEGDAFAQLEALAPPAAGGQPGRLLPGIGVKRLLTVIERTRQAPGETKADAFVNALVAAMER